MSRSRGKAATVFRGILAAAAVLLCGCSIISFDRLTVSVFPSNPNAVLGPGQAPWVEFPYAADQPSVQRLFTISGPDGSITGDFRWDRRRMYFDAAPPLRPGVRYVLEFRGRVVLEDGQSFDTDTTVPFYVGHVGGGPALASSTPVNGAIVGTAATIVLRFSAPVDANSFSREFELQPAIDTDVTWDAPGEAATISPKEAWSNLVTYTWKVGKNCSAPDGTPLGIEYSGSFRVQQDSTGPAVVSVVPALRATLTPTGNDLDHTSADDALLVTFSKDVSMDTLSSAFTLSPSTKGTLTRVAPGVFAFTPDARLVMAQLYTLRIGPTVQDLSGNKLSTAYETSFTPDIPVQAVLSMKAVYLSSEDEWTVFNTLDARPLTVDVDGSVALVVTFQEPFSVERRVALLSGITLAGYFPASVPDPSLVSASWSGGLALTLIYTGLERSNPGPEKYYKLTVAGGAEATDNGAGSFLKEDVWLYFLTNP